MPQPKPEPWALQLAARAWCTPTTSGKTMDPELAEAFALILMQQRDAYQESAAIDAGG